MKNVLKDKLECMYIRAEINLIGYLPSVFFLAEGECVVRIARSGTDDVVSSAVSHASAATLGLKMRIFRCRSTRCAHTGEHTAALHPHTCPSAALLSRCGLVTGPRARASDNKGCGGARDAESY